MEKLKIDIGLDIGIASVGWSISSAKDLSIIQHGARLFKTVDHPKNSSLLNEKRRDERSLRRQNNRRKTLRRDFIKYLIIENIIPIKYDKGHLFIQKFIDKYIENKEWKSRMSKQYGNLYIFHLRKKGLQNSLNNIEMINVLFWYLKHRGYNYEIIGSKNADADAIDLGVAKYKSTGELPVDIQLKFYEDNQKINGTSLNRLIHHNEYLMELKQIFAHNCFFNKLQKNHFIENFFNRKRSFEIGPGNDKSPTPYGRFYKLNNMGKIVKRDIPLKSLWDETIGHCSIYPDQKRAPKMSLSSLVFNLLNDINNIKINETRGLINSELRFKIIEESFSTKSNSNKIMKLLEKEFPGEIISGYREDKKGKPEFTSLKNIVVINKMLKKPIKIKEIFSIKNATNVYIFNINNIFDKIANIFLKTKIKDQRINEMKQVAPHLVNNELEELSLINESFSQTHSLSYKILREIIDISMNECKNMQEIIVENNINIIDKHDYGTQYLKHEWVNELILTPTVKRSLRQTIKVLNSCFNLASDNNWEIDDIVIEMARENNNKKAKDNISNSQKYFNKMNNEINALIEPITHKISKKLKLKIWLWEQQEHRDAYTGELIDINNLIKNSNYYDIDHIIPWSQSYDNSRSNKVLTHNVINSTKDNSTPFQYYKNSDLKLFYKMKSLWAKWYLNIDKLKDKIHLYDKDKYRRLTSEIDFSKPENQLGFIQRNLVDTRYATKAILNALIMYKNKNKLKYKVKTINGKMTSFARYYMSNPKNNPLRRPKGVDLLDEKNKKNRNWHGHHAEDAYIITLINNHYKEGKIIEKILSEPNRKHDIFTKNKIDKNNRVFFDTNFSKLIASLDIGKEELNKNINNILFTRMVEKKMNSKLFNETLYRGKRDSENKNIISKISRLNLLDMDKIKAEKLFGDNSSKKILTDIFLINELKILYKRYATSAKPFHTALEESSTKFSKIKGVNYLEFCQTNKKGQKVIRKIKYISVIENSKNISNIILAPLNGDSFYDSMEWIQLWIYRNMKGKLALIAINATNHNFKMIDGKQIIICKYEEFNKQLEFKQISLGSNPLVKINKGDLLVDSSGEKYYICGASVPANQLEIKYLNVVKKNSQPKQIHKSINAISDYWIIKSNILGTNHKKIFKF